MSILFSRWISSN